MNIINEDLMSVKVLVVGLGNMGTSHAMAYHNNPGFEIVGLMSRTLREKVGKLPKELQGYPLYEDYCKAVSYTHLTLPTKA